MTSWPLPVLAPVEQLLPELFDADFADPPVPAVELLPAPLEALGELLAAFADPFACLWALCTGALTLTGADAVVGVEMTAAARCDFCGLLLPADATTTTIAATTATANPSVAPRHAGVSFMNLSIDHSS